MHKIKKKIKERVVQGVKQNKISLTLFLVCKKEMLSPRYFNIQLEQDMSDIWKVTECAVNAAWREKR